jgi:hypothetical protein
LAWHEIFDIPASEADQTFLAQAMRGLGRREWRLGRPREGRLIVARVHVLARVSPVRLARILALTGGLFWIVKILLIWENGGANRFGGAVGLMFLIGTVLLAFATVLWIWHTTDGRSLLMRAGMLLGGLVALLLVINLLSLVGYFVFPGSWLAGEFGVILVAVAAIIAAFGVTSAGTITNRV